MATTKITNPELFDLASLDTALKLPSGTTAERPTSPSTGEWRYNTDNNLIEFYDGGSWRDLQSEDIPPVNSENFNTVLYTGNGSTQSITGVGFQPDFVWVKVRSTTGSGPLADSTRGTGKAIYSNLTDADYTFPAGQGVTSFDADGFSVGDDATGNGGYNGSGKTYVAWCWKANGGTTTAVSGTNITNATQQVNTSTDFSITQFTEGSSGTSSVPHGLSGTPDMYIVKRTGGSQDWYVWHNGLSAGNSYIILNSTAAQGSNNNMWTQVDSTNINLGPWNTEGGGTKIIYAFKNVAGYSKFGSYTGNAGTLIVETGFEPAFLMIKRTDAATYDWYILDNKRNPQNYRNTILRANANTAEQTVTNGDVDVNFLSNGFSFDNMTSSAGFNASGGTYIYMAFAADPSTAPVLADSFANKLYTGTGVDGLAVTGLGFKPSMVWIKNRDLVRDHNLADVVQGVSREITPNTTEAQENRSVTSFDSDGFTLDNASGNYNANGDNYVAWNWKANPIPTINTDGTIQSLVSANQAAGFSISKWTGNGSAATIGHGLSATPEMIITKRLTGISPWYTYNAYLNGGANPAYYFVNLNTSDAETNNGSSGGSIFNSTPPTSTIFNIGTSLSGSVDDYIAYCFHSVSGYSKFGSYVGNATSNRAITGLGFQPNFVMLKNIASTTFWSIFDSSRGGSLALFANSSQAEANETGVFVSFDSDGFTVNQEPTANGSGNTIIYMAFKENPTP